MLASAAATCHGDNIAASNDALCGCQWHIRACIALQEATKQYIALCTHKQRAGVSKARVTKLPRVTSWLHLFSSVLVQSVQRLECLTVLACALVNVDHAATAAATRHLPCTATEVVEGDGEIKVRSTHERCVVPGTQDCQCATTSNYPPRTQQHPTRQSWVGRTQQ